MYSYRNEVPFYKSAHPSQVVTSRQIDPLTLDLLVHLTIPIRMWIAYRNDMIPKVMTTVGTATEKVACGLN